MSEFLDDGGPVAPTGGTSYDSSWWISGGMRLRDWFAGQVLPAIVANGNNISSEAAAQSAYRFANAMIAMRNSIVEPEPEARPILKRESLAEASERERRRNEILRIREATDDE